MEHLTAENFDKSIGSGTVVVDFYADWCGPCKRLAPIFKELSEEMKNATFAKLNVDEQGSIAQRFGVQSIPTLIVFKDGEPVERVMGLMPKDDLKKIVAAHA